MSVQVGQEIAWFVLVVGGQVVCSCEKPFFHKTKERAEKDKRISISMYILYIYICMYKCICACVCIYPSMISVQIIFTLFCQVHNELWTFLMIANPK